MVEWLKKAPTGVVISVVIVVGFLTAMVLGGFVYLTAIGADTTDFRTFISTLINVVTLSLTGVAALGSVSAARSASKAEEHTNGGLTQLVEQKVEEKLNGNG